MTKRLNLVSLAVVCAAFGSPLFIAEAAQADMLRQIAGCEAGAKIDGTTAAETKKRAEAAGYSQVRDLVKACDNVWHGVAVNKDGTAGNILVTPQGEVMPDGN